MNEEIAIIVRKTPIGRPHWAQNLAQNHSF